MGQVANSNTKKTLIIVLLFSILVLSSSALMYSAGSNTQPNNYASQLAGSDPQAAARPVNESAIGFDSAGGKGRLISLPGSGNMPVTLDYNWAATSLTTTVLSLTDQRNWMVNGSFKTGVNTPHAAHNSSAPWTTQRYPGTGDAHLDSGNWVSSGNPAWGYVNASMPWADTHIAGTGYPARTYYVGEYDAWNETFVVPRGTVLAANLSMAYHPNFAAVLAYASLEIYVEINSNLVYYNTFANINSAGERNVWNQLANFNVLLSVNNTQVFNTPTATKMNVSIGVAYTGKISVDFDFQTPPVSQNGCWFTNATLSLKTQVKPEQIKLKVAPQSAPNTNTSITSPSPSTYGAGSGTLTGFTIGPAPSQQAYYFTFTSNVTSPAICYFVANATIHVIRANTATATFLSQGVNVKWNVSFSTWLIKNGQSFSTTNYTKYYYNVSLPSDWSLLTCIDPSGVSHPIVTGPIFTNWTEGNIRILRVNVTYVNQYSTPPNYYPYIISALSNNYVKNVFTQLRSASAPYTYSNSTKFYPQNTTRISAYIAGPSGPMSSGIANLTIYGPTTYDGPQVKLNYITGVQPVSGYAYFTVLWNGTNPAGNYSAQVDWANTLIGEGGSLTSGNFSIWHRFSLTIIFPAAGDVIISPSTLSNPPTTVTVQDIYTGQSLTATVKGKASWELKTTPWPTFSATANLGTYTNITDVPTLPINSAQWIAVNASKPFYNLALTNNTIYIGTQTTCTLTNPLTGTDTVRYTENQSFYVTVNATYEYYPSGSPIPGAQLTLLAGASSNNSVVQWNARTVLNTRQNAQGLYSATIYMFVQSAGGIPAGSTYTIYFKVSASGYYETQTFSLTLIVDTQPTQLTAYSGDAAQTLFWGQTAQVRLSFTTRPAGSYDWPGTSLILNSTYYAPPYVTVTTDWGGQWVVNASAYYPGTYVFYINTTWFSTPTNDGSGVGTTTVHIVLHKEYYEDPVGVAITLSIMRLTTRETGAVQQFGGYLLTNSTSAYPGDIKSVFVWYNDTHTGSSVGIGGASVSYTSSGDIFGSGSLAGVAGSPGLYNLTLTSTFTNETPGIYDVYVATMKGNDYVQQNVTITLTILPLPTVLQSYSPTVTVYYKSTVVYLIWFNDTHNNVPIGGATMSVTAPGVTLISPFEVPGQPGLWNLTIPAGQAVGRYTITLQATKAKYTTGTVALTLNVNNLLTAFKAYTVKSGLVYTQPNATVPQGQLLTIYLWFNDTVNGVPIPGMNGSITFTSSGSPPEFGSGTVQVTSTPGLYMVSFKTPDAGKFTITFTASVPGYENQQIVFQVTVQAPPPGFSIVTLAIVGAGGGGIVLVAVAAMIFIRRARMPFIIKKINETLGLINKGQHEQATPVALKSRDEIVAGIMAERVESFTKRKPSKEEEAAAAMKEEVVPAPTPETSAALKEELKAVEGKEEPEEGIEEVEMNTLDEQLQQLEKVESKENLPDGAKEVRDVIEKYKEGKKKKKEE